MDIFTLPSVAGVLGFFIGTFITYLFKLWYDTRRKSIVEFREKQKEVYQRLMALLIDIMHNSKKIKEMGITEEKQKELQDIYKIAILYSSDRTIERLNEFIAFSRKNFTDEYFIKLFGDLLISLRRDLGLSQNRFSEIGKRPRRVLRGLISDYDQIFQK